MRVSLPVRKNVRVDNYHYRFVLPSDGDSPSSQPVCTTIRRWWCAPQHCRLAIWTSGDTLITNGSYYEPLVIAITIVFNDTGGDRGVDGRSICSSVCLRLWAHIRLILCKRNPVRSFLSFTLIYIAAVDVGYYMARLNSSNLWCLKRFVLHFYATCLRSKHTKKLEIW